MEVKDQVTADRLIQARTHCAIKHGFFGRLLFEFSFIERFDIPTAATDGINFYYNPTWMRTLTNIQTKTIMIHEVLHPAMLYWSRQGSRDNEKWNMAHDYEINNIIHRYNKKVMEEEGGNAIFDFPKGVLLDEKYNGKVAEEIYKLIKTVKVGVMSNDVLKQKSYGKGENEKTLTDKEIKTKWELAVLNAVEQEKEAGTIPAEFEKYVEQIKNPKIPWQLLLKNFISEVTKCDTSWNKPNRNYLYYDIYFPALGIPSLGHIIFATDSSGSVYNIVGEFIAEGQEILDTCNPSRFTFLECDAAIQQALEYEAGDRITMKAKGGGGTDFRPVFDWVKKQNEEPVALIYLTDLEGTLPEVAPNYPVLWIIKNSRNMVAPFGTSIHI